MRSLRFLLGPLWLLCLALAVACGDPFALSKPRYQNLVDTVTLYALNGGTPVRTPSAYFIGTNDLPPEPVLIQNGSAFDFAVDLDTLNQVVVLPTGALHLGLGSGVQTTTTPFDSIRIAPTAGFKRDSAVAIPVGGRAIVHSRDSQCSNLLTVVYYAKLEILAVDTASRKITFQILVDDNCGYRGLEPGFPAR
jgi:hypothetical protein